jgi:hypothetical protein
MEHFGGAHLYFIAVPVKTVREERKETKMMQMRTAERGIVLNWNA